MLSGLCFLSLMVFVSGLSSIMMISPQTLSERYVALSKNYSDEKAELFLIKAIESDPYNGGAWLEYASVAKMNNSHASFLIAEKLDNNFTMSQSVVKTDTLRMSFLTIE